jgi:hypothetical protein
MVNGIIFGTVGNWDSKESEKVKIGFGTCRNPFLIPIYVTLGEKTCIVVLIEGVFDTFEERKLFMLMLDVKHFESIVGMEVFWPLKDLSMDNVVITTKLEQCCATTNNCNNLGKKQVLCH